MFTLQQIETAHARVKSGADFPAYIRTIKESGVTSFTTWVKDSHTEYKGAGDSIIRSLPQYRELMIADKINKEQFIQQLKSHQRGETDYMTFCKDCAATGIEKWVADLNAFTCIYYDTAGNEILSEDIPY